MYLQSEMGNLICLRHKIDTSRKFYFIFKMSVFSFSNAQRDLIYHVYIVRIKIKVIRFQCGEYHSGFTGYPVFD